MHLALSEEKDGSDSPMSSNSDTAPRQRRVQRSPTLVKKGQAFSVPPMHAHAKENAPDERRRKRKKNPSSSSSSSSSLDHRPPSSPSLSKDKESNSSPKRTKGRRRMKSYATKGCFCRYCKFKKGGKSITFLTYDATFGAIDKILAFIQQYRIQR